MTRVMFDAVDPSGLPTNGDLYAGYVDGLYANVGAIQARFPGKTVVGIAVFPSTNNGTVLDVETGDATPSQAPGWVQMRRAAGVDPTVYCSEGVWGQVQQAFNAAGVPQPHYWVAAYPGEGAVVPAGAVAHQWIDHGACDESVVADYWPGVDSAAPVPPTPPPPPQEDDMGSNTGIVTITEGALAGTDIVAALVPPTGDLWLKDRSGGNSFSHNTNQMAPGNFIPGTLAMELTDTNDQVRILVQLKPSGAVRVFATPGSRNPDGSLTFGHEDMA